MTCRGIILSPVDVRGVLYGLLAAALFGVSAPLAKLLLPRLSPWPLAGLLYLGAALGLTIAGRVRSAGSEAPLRRTDAPVLAAVIGFGGVAGPLLLLFGLERLPAASASLLTNLEGVFTILLAVVWFGEHLSRSAGIGAAVVIAGGCVLGWGWERGAGAAGPLLVAAACAAWAIDNNLTQRLAARDPVAVARVKTAAAGAVNATLAVVSGARLPALAVIAAALAVGALSYGLSLVLYLGALRRLGAARAAALFGTAPFVGAAVAVPLLGVGLTRWQLLAGSLMALGVALLLREQHAHLHTHDAIEHEHAHDHDEHHQHEHAPGQDPRGPHSHVHRHEPLTHAHPHAPDLHHRHKH
jgi:drug/metabolite transporter (DMT)-like permease